jgi:TPR repeat protein
LGVTKNVSLAKQWLQKASSQGCEEAATALKKIQAEEEDVRRAKQAYEGYLRSMQEIEKMRRRALEIARNRRRALERQLREIEDNIENVRRLKKVATELNWQIQHPPTLSNKNYYNGY